MEVPLFSTVHQITARTQIYTTQEAAFRTPLVLLKIVCRKGSKVAFQWSAHFSAMRNAWHHHLRLHVTPYIFVCLNTILYLCLSQFPTGDIVFYTKQWCYTKLCSSAVIADACVCSLLPSLCILMRLHDCFPSRYFLQDVIVSFSRLFEISVIAILILPSSTFCSDIGICFYDMRKLEWLHRVFISSS